MAPPCPSHPLCPKLFVLGLGGVWGGGHLEHFQPIKNPRSTDIISLWAEKAGSMARSKLCQAAPVGALFHSAGLAPGGRTQLRAMLRRHFLFHLPFFGIHVQSHS